MSFPPVPESSTTQPTLEGSDDVAPADFPVPGSLNSRGPRSVSDCPTEKPMISQNVFATRIQSTNSSTINLSVIGGGTPAYFRSRRVKKVEIEKPWLEDDKDKKQKWQTLLPLLGLLAGFGIGAFMVYDGWTSVPAHHYCTIYEDDFSSGTSNEDVWDREAEVGGFGNGQFEQTTITNENVYIANGMLAIKPTLQDEDLITQNSIIDLTQMGKCSLDVWSSCVAVTNTTNGTIVPPTESGLISTKGAKIKYGRIEVVAKLPEGDWLWPAIWMLPEGNTYGE